MQITLIRAPSGNGWTLGRLSIDGKFQCYTCEDVTRPAGEKVPGQTAIPSGRYRVIVNVSPRFTRLAGHEVRLPLLLDVPGFEGVRIHVGNVARDTEGCILPGVGYRLDGVTHSQAAFEALMARIESAIATGHDVWIEISQPGMSAAATECAAPPPGAPMPAGPALPEGGNGG